ncbi:ParB N-terminal domain-containing protein (plasmid) [Leptospira interrogans]|uniref:ParB/RepB/Spo0J family partition protein n=1 Tax=Leptospira interrogans TaxID=173 RepID=UPI001F4D0CA1|nr:ParB N-terminal domain-containing protein [Leptospira interrogans]UNE65293.1 ParB N-terminal domain-containing protein [Leptospira interrogans]
MKVLQKEEITNELAEIILDKIHLAMTKENPYWQDTVMDDKEGGEELYFLQESSLKKVFQSSEKTLSSQAKEALSKEFENLGALDLVEILKNIDLENQESDDFLQKSSLLDENSIILEIVNEKGSFREGFDLNGKPWKGKLFFDYGYIQKSNIDEVVGVFLGPEKNKNTYFLINQYDKDGNFDEHKLMLGFRKEKDAKKAYLKHYPKNWKGLGSIVTLDEEGFQYFLNQNEIQKEFLNPKIEILKSKLIDLRFILKKERRYSQYIEVQKSEIINDLKKTNETELYKLLKSIILESCFTLEEILKAKLGRPAAQLGETSVWTDGKTRIKTAKGWRIIKNYDNQENQNENNIKKEPSPKKGNSYPSKLPFRNIRTIEQYTDKKDFDRNQIESLKIKIKDKGYDPSFPLSVDLQEGKWTIVAGHHRYEAVKELIEEGHLPEFFEVPVVVKSFASSNDRLIAQISENQRRNVLPTDEAKAYGKLIETGWNAKQISEELGIKLGEVNRRLALNNLSPELFALVQKKDRSLPLGVAETIGMFAKDANDKPNQTIQIRAFKWFQENRSKYGSRAVSALQSYIKELQSGEFENFNFDSVATNVQKEALKTIGSREKALSNQKMLEMMLENITKNYQKILGDNISSLSPQTSKELAASIALCSDKGVGSTAILGKLGIIIQDLTQIQHSLQTKLKEIEDNSTISLLF